MQWSLLADYRICDAWISSSAYGASRPCCYRALKLHASNFAACDHKRGNTLMGYSTATPLAGRQTAFAEVPARNEAHSSGVSWAAVFAGAFVAAALSVVLLALGTGLGLSSVSPWAGVGASASTIGTAAIVWLILMQIICSSMGGYLAGRLRTKWASIHTDEVYFRDTAHGFLVWAVGLVLTASFMATAAASMMGISPNTSSATTSRSSSSGVITQDGERSADPNAYFLDALLRGNPTNREENDGATRGEAGLILANGLRLGALPPKDSAYLTQLVAARTGVNEAEAQRRVADAFSQSQQAADTARKALAHLSLWLFVALLIGAFCASFAATIGGRQRDHVQLV
jgi:hypothetical protein